MKQGQWWTVWFERSDGREISFDIIGATKKRAIENSIEEAEDEIADGFYFKSISKTSNPKIKILECGYAKMHRMCELAKEGNTEEFLAENEQNLYASALSNISSEVGAFGNSAMFNHIFKIIRESDYGKDWCFIGRCLYYADKHNNEELIVEIVKYITDWNIVEDCFYHSEKAYSFYDSERDGDVSQILIKYFDYTNLLSKDWIHHDIKEILVKQKLHNGLQEKLPEKGTSTFSKI